MTPRKPRSTSWVSTGGTTSSLLTLPCWTSTYPTPPTTRCLPTGIWADVRGNPTSTTSSDQGNPQDPNVITPTPLPLSGEGILKANSGLSLTTRRPGLLKRANSGPAGQGAKDAPIHSRPRFPGGTVPVPVVHHYLRGREVDGRPAYLVALGGSHRGRPPGVGSCSRTG